MAVAVETEQVLHLCGARIAEPRAVCTVTTIRVACDEAGGGRR